MSNTNNNEPPASPFHALAQQLVAQNQKMLDEMHKYREEYVKTAKVMEQFPYGPFRRIGEEGRIIELYRTNDKAREELRAIYNKYATASAGNTTGETHG